MRLLQGDCISVMQELIDEEIKVDLILTDPPYGTTACNWDSVIPFDEMWACLKQLRKDTTPILLFGTEPYSSYLRISNITEYKYDWIWHKNGGSGFALARRLVIDDYVIDYNRGKYPESVQFFKRVHNANGGRLHPSQKPVDLLEYLIRTYSNPNDLVLDFTMGSGSTGVACQNLNREFIGIELDKEYYDIAVERLKENMEQTRLI